MYCLSISQVLAEKVCPCFNTLKRSLVRMAETEPRAVMLTDVSRPNAAKSSYSFDQGTFIFASLSAVAVEEPAFEEVAAAAAEEVLAAVDGGQPFEEVVAAVDGGQPFEEVEETEEVETEDAGVPARITGAEDGPG